jgi:hypothetical protein
MENNAAVAAATFDRNYQLHPKHLTLKGLQPIAVKACLRGYSGSASTSTFH